MFFALIKSDNKTINLRKFNLILGIIQLIQALIIFAVSNKYTVTLTSNYLHPVYNYDSGFSYFENQTSEVITLRLSALVATFLFIAALGHFITISPGVYEWYIENLKKRLGYLRWIEYSFSMSLMFTVISILAGIKDMQSLLGIFFLCFFMNMFFLLMERVNQRRITIDWLPYVLGIVVSLILLTVISFYIYGGASGYSIGDQLNAIPRVVYIIILSSLIWLILFLLNIYLSFRKIEGWSNYFFSEVIYILLGLFSKLFLAWQIWYFFLS